MRRLMIMTCVIAMILIGGYLALEMGRARVDPQSQQFRILFNSVAYAILAIMAVLIVPHSRTGWRGLLPVVIAFAATSLLLYLSWGPLYYQIAGAPMIGFVLMPLWTTLTMGAGLLLGLLISGWLGNRTRRAERRLAAGLCVRCCYDLGALSTYRCPECGSRIARSVELVR